MNRVRAANGDKRFLLKRNFDRLGIHIYLTLYDICNRCCVLSFISFSFLSSTFLSVSIQIDKTRGYK